MDTEKLTSLLGVTSDEYTQIYDRIRVSGHARWLTLSPPPDDGADPRLGHIYWLKKLTKMHGFTTDLLLVAEVSPNARLHYHMFYSVKDRVKEYIYLNGWRRESNIKVFNGEPREGIGYLQKDILSTSEYLPGYPVSFTRDTLRSYVLAQKRRKRAEELARKTDKTHGVLKYCDCKFDALDELEENYIE